MRETEGASASAGGSSWPQGFWSLIATQFQGAFNDNGVKYLVIYLVVAMNLPKRQEDALVFLIGALFAVPFLLFSMAGGYLADRFSKRSVTIGTKLMEIGVMLFATVGLALQNLPMECAAVFLISAQAALFGPSKYGLLPELLPERELSWGNGIIELGTFLAAISATVAAGFLAYWFRGRQILSGLLLLGFTVVGLLCSLAISRVPAADPAKRFRWNPLGDLRAQFREIGRDRVLTWAVLGNTYLWFLAALLQFTIVIYGHDVLHLNTVRISYLGAAVGIGIGIGSLAAGYLSGGKIEYGLIPLGATGMTIFAALLARPGLSELAVAEHLALLGFFGGFFAVPLSALIQHRPPEDRKGGVIAAANWLSFVGVAAAAGTYYVLSSGLHLQPGSVFLAGAVMTLLASGYLLYLLPDSLLRFLLWLATRSIYITITDRLSRFSKIDGEMVPHIKVEETLQELAGTTEQSFVVTGVPDGKKGERLVVLHTLAEEKLKLLLEKLPESGLPNLWTPRANQFFRVEELPILGSGKLDLRRAHELALRLSPEP